MLAYDLSCVPAETNFFPKANNLKQVDFRVQLDTENGPKVVASRIYCDINGALSQFVVPEIANDAAEVIRDHFTTCYKTLNGGPIPHDMEKAFRDEMKTAMNAHGVDFKMFMNMGFSH